MTSPTARRAKTKRRNLRVIRALAAVRAPSKPTIEQGTRR